jgi:hypothetical protein
MRADLPPDPIESNKYNIPIIPIEKTTLANEGTAASSREGPLMVRIRDTAVQQFALQSESFQQPKALYKVTSWLSLVTRFPKLYQKLVTMFAKITENEVKQERQEKKLAKYWEELRKNFQKYLKEIPH